MDFGTMVMFVFGLGFLCVMLSLAYDLGKQDGRKDCAPDVERADRYRMAVDSLDKWCGHEFLYTRLIADHLFAQGEGLAMNAGTPCSDEPCTISGLREQLRRMSAKTK